MRHGTLRRLFLALSGFAIIAWLGIASLNPSNVQVPFSTSLGYEIVSDDALPEYPSAVIVTDHRGRTRWTVFVPPQQPFPLRPEQYRDLCEQADHLSHELDMGSNKKSRLSYYAKDSNFIDVGEAARRGLLPNVGEQSPNEGVIEVMKGDGMSRIGGQKMCDKSLTYVMETDDAGMGNTLMGLWAAYGLAQKEGRAFFIDDTRWPYGNYTNYFKPPPLPLCTPPPPTQRLPCPHSAAHLVISSATFPWAFGAAFEAEYADAHKPRRKAQRRVFALLRAGYEALFHLSSADDVRYVKERVTRVLHKGHEGGVINIGLHVRRGDVHPWEYQFAHDYLPLTRYVDEVQQILIDAYEHNDNFDVTDPSEQMDRHRGTPGMSTSQLFLASDDPDVYTAPEVSRAQRAQDRIVLASKAVLEQEALKNSGGSRPRKEWIDSIHGWDGGFYHDQFFGLGMPEPGTAAPPGPGGFSSAPAAVLLGAPHRRQTRSRGGEDVARGEMPESALALRSLVGRAYVLDLAVLARMDAVVCAASAAACRILAVMMGADKAFAQRRWRNVDAGFKGWRGLVLGEVPD